jgi:hypothetical protein
VENKLTKQKRARRKKEEKFNVTVVFNGKRYSGEEWKVYCEPGEPSKIISDYFESDQCPPERKAAWDGFWRSIIGQVLAEIEAEEKQSENVLPNQQDCTEQEVEEHHA